MIDIKSALGQLDVTKDEQWTSDGLPRLDALKALTGDASLTREKLEASVPGFTRAVAQGGAPSAPAAAPAAVQQPWTPNTVQAAPAAVVQPPAPVVPAPGAPPAPSAAPAPVVKTAEQVASELEQAENELADAKDRLTQIDKYLEQGKAARLEAIKKLEAADKAVDALRPPDSNIGAIRAYLDAQQKIRDKRLLQINAAQAFQAEHNIKLADLIPKRAPIDQAMARRNTRGMNRPGSK